MFHFLNETGGFLFRCRSWVDNDITLHVDFRLNYSSPLHILCHNLSLQLIIFTCIRTPLTYDWFTYFMISFMIRSSESTDIRHIFRLEWDSTWFLVVCFLFVDVSVIPESNPWGSRTINLYIGCIHHYCIESFAVFIHQQQRGCQLESVGWMDRRQMGFSAPSGGGSGPRPFRPRRPPPNWASPTSAAVGRWRPPRAGLSPRAPFHFKSYSSASTHTLSFSRILKDSRGFPKIPRKFLGDLGWSRV